VEPLAGPRSIGGVAKEAERLGFDSVVFSEHLVTPLIGDEPPIGQTWPELYVLYVLAAYLAGITSRLSFLLYATVVPYRHPILQASQIATLDQVSHGRLTLVAGIGWLRDEFDALGVPFAHRGARTDVYLAAMRGLWTQEEFAFDGRYVSFAKVAREPKCFQSPHVPIWIVGVGPHVTQRIIDFGTGWGAPIPWPIDKLARHVTRIKHAVAEAGRDPEALRFAAGLSFGPPDPAASAASWPTMGSCAVNGSITDGLVGGLSHRPACRSASRGWRPPPDRAPSGAAATTMEPWRSARCALRNWWPTP
jgi:probable F420-dependent oxidoreductase